MSSNALQTGQTSGGIYQLVNLFSGGASAAGVRFRPGHHAVHHGQHHRPAAPGGHPRFQQLYEEGASGQSKLTQYTRYLTIALGLLNATTLVSLARSGQLLPNCQLPIIPDDSIVTTILIIITLTAGTGLIMWMGELVTEKGVGNGMSLLIFTSIVAGFPGSLGADLDGSQGPGTFFLVLVIGLLTVAAWSSWSSPSDASRCSTPSA